MKTTTWVSAATGFGIGMVASAMYLVLGGSCFFTIPLWARIVFYPGFVAGVQVNEWGLSVGASKIAGVIVVGLAYAAAATLSRMAWCGLKRRRQSAHLNQEAEREAGRDQDIADN